MSDTKKRVLVAVLVVVMGAFVGTQAEAHPNHPHSTVGVRKHFRGHNGHARRWRPGHDVPTPLWPDLGTDYPQGTVCKSTGQDGTQKHAVGGDKLYQLYEQVVWCYVPGRSGFVSYDVNISNHTEGFAHWSFQEYDQMVRSSVRPWEYRYSRTGGVWVFTLPWPIPLNFHNSVWVTHTVRVDGTYDWGWGPK